MWLGYRKKDIAIRHLIIPVEVKGILQVAKKRCAGIVRFHILSDHPMSLIVQDCYLQGVEDTVTSIERHHKIKFDDKGNTDV